MATWRSRGEVACPRLLTLPPADEFGVIGEVRSLLGLPLPHLGLGRPARLGARRRGGAVLVPPDTALDRPLPLCRLVPVGVVGVLDRGPGHAGEECRQAVPAIGVLETAPPCLVDAARDVHADGAPVLDGVLDLDRAGAAGSVEAQYLALERLADRALVRGVADDHEVEAGGAQLVAVRLDRGPSGRGPYGHLRVARHLPCAPAAVDERPQPPIGKPFHRGLGGLPAGVDAEQGSR